VSYLFRGSKLLDNVLGNDINGKGEHKIKDDARKSNFLEYGVKLQYAATEE
jgi:hypothetical protein